MRSRPSKSEHPAPGLTSGMEPLFDMANLRPKSTGLPMVIWVSEKGRSRHGPRVKVSLQRGEKMDVSNTVTVTIEDEPRMIGEGLAPPDLAAVNRYILLNRESLLAYWNGDLDTVELVAKLRPVTRA